MRTARALHIQVTKTTGIDVPVGTELIRVPDGEGKPMYAVRYPLRFAASTFAHHDLSHYYAWVPADAVDGAP